MTACVNETKKTVGGGVLQSKVLRAVMALVLAIGLMPVASGTALADQTGGIGINAATSSIKAVLDKTDVEWESYNGGETNLIKVYLETSDGSAPAAGLTTQVQAYVESDELAKLYPEQDGKIAASEPVTVSSDAFDGGKGAVVYLSVPAGYAGKYSVKVGESWIATTYTVDKMAVSSTGINGTEQETPYTGKDIDLQGFYQVKVVETGEDLPSDLWTATANGSKTVKDAGTYEPTVSLTDEAFVNYVFGGSKGQTAAGQFELTVTKANPAISWNADNSVNGDVDGTKLTVGYFGGKVDVQASDVVVTGVDGYRFTPGDDYTIEVSDGTVGKLTNGAAVEAGDYNVTVTFKDTEATRNHQVAEGQGLILEIVRATNFTANQAFARGEVTQARDGGNFDLTSQLAEGVEWTYDTEAHTVTVEKVVPYGETEEVDVTDPDKFSQAIYPVVDGEVVYEGGPLASPRAAGTYAVVVTPQEGSGYEAQGDDENLSLVFEYEISPIDIAGAVAFDANDWKSYSVDDDTFTWNAGNQTVGIALDGRDITGEVEVRYYDADHSQVEYISDPGTYYVAGYSNSGNYAGEFEVSIVVDRLDLAQAGLVVNDTNEDIAIGENADKYLELAASSPVKDLERLKREIVASVDRAMTSHGQYTLSVAPASQVDDDNYEGDRPAFVTGSWSDSFNYVETVVPAANFYYDDETLAEFDGTVYSADHANGFDPKKVTVWQDKGKNLAYEQGKDYTVAVTRDGQAVTSYDAPGTYTVTVAMDAAGSGYELGGKATASFKVVSGSLADADIIVTDVESGKVVPTVISQVTEDAATFTYDGTDQSDNFSVLVEMDGTALVAGSDYSVVLTQGGSYYYEGTMTRNLDAAVVGSATNVGTYYLNVIGGNYADWTAVEFTVAPIDVAELRVQQTEFAHRNDVNGNWLGIPYTGSQITPVVEYCAEGSTAWTVLPADLYRLDYFEVEGRTGWSAIEAADVVDVADYRVDALLLDCDLAENFDFSGVKTTDLEFSVIDRVFFQDVVANEWYAERVHEAWAEGYVNGYSLTELFGPDNAITRGDVACVLFNVATNGGWADLDWWTNQGSSYSAFPDVEAGVYWTAAINWASSAKVVNGYASTGLFEPSKNITREEFASMLANFAKALKVYEEPASGALGAFADADGVSEWAEENVAWAAENGVMGNGGFLNAQGTITRAEVAAMVMNFVEEFDVDFAR